MMTAIEIFLGYTAGFFIWSVETIKAEPRWIFWLLGTGGAIYVAIEGMLDYMLNIKKEYRQAVRRG